MVVQPILLQLKNDVEFTSVTTGNTSMNDGGITIKATEGGKTNVNLNQLRV